MKNFSIFRVENKKSDKQPDYRISAAIGKEFTEIGACWIKESKSGKKYMSCKLSDIYVDHTKGTARKGFMIVDEAELKKLTTEVIAGSEPMVEKIEKIDSGEIPF